MKINLRSGTEYYIGELDELHTTGSNPHESNFESVMLKIWDERYTQRKNILKLRKNLFRLFVMVSLICDLCRTEIFVMWM